MNFKNYKDKTFNELPELIVGSNFENCIFNVKTKFEKCNIYNSSFNKDQHFYLSNVINCTGADNSIFELSNNVKEEENVIKE